MRVAPLGAYFADDLDRTVVEATRSAEVTHAHPEGIAGAIAVSIAAAIAARDGARGVDLLRAVCDHVPRGYTRDGIEEAIGVDASETSVRAAATLGNGSGVTAADTVPFCLWIVAHRAASFEEALWETVAGLGDRDTTCAIVGGLVAARDGAASIPAAWRRAREPLPAWMRE